MIISIVNHKGRTGKTTTSVNLASALHKLRKKVLVIDLAPQGNLSFSLGINKFTLSIADLFLNNTALSEIIIQTNSIAIAPCDISLSNVELNISTRSDRNELHSVKNQFDYIIIDCPPSLSLLTVNALTASDHVIIPLQLEVLSIKGLGQIIETVTKISKKLNPTINILGVVPVMVDKRKNLNGEVLNFITKNFTINLFDSHIRTNVKASEAPSFGKSVINYAPKSHSALDYLKLANELLYKTK